jgi:hypothetical protein
MTKGICGFDESNPYKSNPLTLPSPLKREENDRKVIYFCRRVFESLPH